MEGVILSLLCERSYSHWFWNTVLLYIMMIMSKENGHVDVEKEMVSVDT